MKSSTKNTRKLDLKDPSPEMIPDIFDCPIIKGVKYTSVWFDNLTKKELGRKHGSKNSVETGRKFRLAETRVCDLFELVSPPPKYKNGKYYINYNGGSVGSNKQKVEIWVLVEDEKNSKLY